MLKDYSKLVLASNYQYVLVDTDVKKAEIAYPAHIPMSFWIEYPDGSKPIPELALLINPSNMDQSYSKKINYNWTRGGYIPEDWGDMQDTITVNGRTGGFYTRENGLNRFYKTKSAAFQNLFALFLIYKNNGIVFQDTSTTPSTTSNLISGVTTTNKQNSQVLNTLKSANNRPYKVGTVFMHFDDTIYQVAFDEFSMEESSDSPFVMTYSFKLTVQYRNKIENKPYTSPTQVFYKSS